jgi:hypothetical protein
MPMKKKNKKKKKKKNKKKKKKKTAESMGGTGMVENGKRKEVQ